MQNTKSIILNTAQIAEYLTHYLPDFFGHSEPGIYIRGQIEPAIVPGKNYYQHIVEPGTPFQEIPYKYGDSIVGAIYNEDGMCVLPKGVVKKGLFDDAPFISQSSTKFLYQLVMSIIASNSKFTSEPKESTRDIIYRFIPENIKYPNVTSSHPLFKEKLNDCMEVVDHIQQLVMEHLYELLDAVKTFVKPHPWSMFAVTDNMGDIVITRHMDYRIWDWHQRNNIPVDPADQ